MPTPSDPTAITTIVDGTIRVADSNRDNVEGRGKRIAWMDEEEFTQ